MKILLNSYTVMYNKFVTIFNFIYKNKYSIQYLYLIKYHGIK